MDTLLARQPVFDAQERLFGYDLSIRRPSGQSGSEHPEDLLVTAALGHGIDRVVGGEGLPAFLTVDRRVVENRSVHLLPPDRIIAQLAGATAEDERMVDVCRQLREDGYRVSLVPTDVANVPDALLFNADIVKVDVAATPVAGVGVSRLRSAGVRALALNVRHRAQRDRCFGMGFELFQGYRFSTPETLVRRDLATSSALTFRVLKLVRDPHSVDTDIEAMLSQDVSLSYKLLRMVNSAAYGGREIWSIGHALRLLGREQIGRWLGLLLLTDRARGGVRGELIQLALVRARLAEALAVASGVPRSAGPLFLVGLLSVLDQILETPMEALVGQMELASDVRLALLHREDYFGAVLAMIEAYEQGAWEEVEAWAAVVGVTSATLGVLYLKAIEWASDQTRQSERRHTA